MSKPYPRPFPCESPTCGKVLGIVSQDSQRNVTLFVLKYARPKDFELTDDMQLTKGDFAVMRMGYGTVPCECGHDTTWHWNQHLMDALVRRTK